MAQRFHSAAQHYLYHNGARTNSLGDECAVGKSNEDPDENCFFGRRNIMVCSKWPKDHLCKIWGKNVRWGARYVSECNVLHNGEIRFRMKTQMKKAIFEIQIFFKQR